jgi:hypothetical protein
MTAEQDSDYIRAAAVLDDLPKVQWLLDDRGYDADWFRDALEAKGFQPFRLTYGLPRSVSRPPLFRSFVQATAATVLPSVLYPLRPAPKVTLGTKAESASVRNAIISTPQKVRCSPCAKPARLAAAPVIDP